ncbi:MAG TPA: hypothetical protein PLL06_05630 [Acidobacteriota bacterium]|nr:hypothetical protein [Acidobacteriota bacterium]
MFAVPVFGQLPTPNDNAPEYGQLSEIKGLRKVYVMSSDTQCREIIVKELNKAKIFEVVGSPEEGEFGVFYETGQGRAGWNTFGFAGQFVVYSKPLQNPDPAKPRMRVLWSTQKMRVYSSGITFNRHPATNATREFVKQYKKLKK